MSTSQRLRYCRRKSDSFHAHPSLRMSSRRGGGAAEVEEDGIDVPVALGTGVVLEC